MVLTESESIDKKAKFERLYRTHSAKIFGFIKQYSQTKEQAEEYLTTGFIKVMKEINDLDINEDQQIRKIVLISCKPLLQLRKYITPS